MKKTVNQKALSMFLAILLALGVFASALAGIAATVKFAGVTAFAATPGVTINTQLQDEIKTVGESVTFTVSATGNNSDLTYEWKKDNVVINGQTGSSYTISSVQLSDAGTYTVTVTDTGAATPGATQTTDSDSSSCMLTVNPLPTNAPAITTTALADGTVGTAYSQTLVATGDSTIAWSVITGNLPAGLSLNTNTGVISGTPTKAETANFTVQATNSVGSATQALRIMISSAPPVITDVILLSAYTDGSFTTPTTKLTFVFDQDITDLTASDITLSGVTLTKGALTKTGFGTYELAVSNIAADGLVTYSITKAGYNIAAGTNQISVYKGMDAQEIRVNYLNYWSDGKVGDLWGNLTAAGPLFNADGTVKVNLKPADVTVTAADGTTKYNPTYVNISGAKGGNSYDLLMNFKTKLPKGKYTVSIAKVDGYTFNIVNNNFDVYEIIPKPVITIGSQKADGVVPVNAKVPNYSKEDVDWYVGVNLHSLTNLADGTSIYDFHKSSIDFEISRNEPDKYPTKFIEVQVSTPDSQNAGTTATYEFKPAASDFQIIITEQSKPYEKINSGGKEYYYVAALSALNAQGDVTYNIDENSWNNNYEIIDGNKLCRQVIPVISAPEGDHYEDGTATDWDDTYLYDWFEGKFAYIVGSVSGTDGTSVAYANALLEKIVKPVTPPATPKPKPGSSSGGGGGGSGKSDSSSSSSSSGNSASAPSSNVSGNGSVNQGTVVNEMRNALNSASANGTAVVKVKNAESISSSTLKALANEAAQAGREAVIHADTVGEDGKIQGRLYVDASKLQGVSGDIKLGVNTQGPKVEARQAQFEKFFDNTIAVISCAQQGSFGAELKMAAKVDLSNMNVDTLKFYSFDAATGKYTEIQTEYRIDNNGFVHFTTALAGDIIISDSPLTKK